MGGGDAVVGFLHPGQMGGSLAMQCIAAEKLWVGADRSAATSGRAAEAGCRDAGSIESLVASADVIVSICPPAAALDVAAGVAGADFEGIFVDANAVAPATAHRIAEMFDRFVDGGVVGPPARQDGTTRLYLSGVDAASVAALWAGSWVDARTVGTEPGEASAVKMAYASWTKGSAALLMASRALARAYGVDDALMAEWALSQPGLADRHDRSVRGAGPKAWRFVGEMHEIASSYAAVGLPDGFHLAAAEIYDLVASGDLEHD